MGQRPQSLIRKSCIETLHILWRKPDAFQSVSRLFWWHPDLSIFIRGLFIGIATSVCQPQSTTCFHDGLKRRHHTTSRNRIFYLSVYFLVYVRLAVRDDDNGTILEIGLYEFFQTFRRPGSVQFFQTHSRFFAGRTPCLRETLREFVYFVCQRLKEE